MRFSAGFTLFYPSKEEMQVVLNYSKIFDKIYIFDNSDKFEKQQENELEFINNDKIKYFSTGQNLGLSVALNQICKIASNDGFEYVCLFDQDSYISDDDLKKIFDVIANNTDEFVGVFCPEILYDHEINKKVYRENSIEEINWAITSGSFINLKIFETTSGFDEKYFIDRLDFDYCFYLRKRTYKVIQIKNAFLHQQLGEKRTVLGMNISEHNAIRHYYVFRNRLYFYLSKQFSFFNVFKVIIMSFKHLFSILLESNRKRKIKILWKSILDYSRGNMEKFVD